MVALGSRRWLGLVMRKHLNIPRNEQLTWYSEGEMVVGVGGGGCGGLKLRVNRKPVRFFSIETGSVTLDVSFSIYACTATNVSTIIVIAIIASHPLVLCLVRCNCGIERCLQAHILETAVSRPQQRTKTNPSRELPSTVRQW